MVEHGLSLESVLESVVRITEQRSRDTLEQCLVATLAELADFSMVAIARPQPQGDTIAIECMARAESGRGLIAHDACSVLDEQPLMARAWQTGDEAADRLPDGLYRHCLPVAERGGGIAAFLVVEAVQPLAPHLPVLRGFAAVYRNYLSVLSDAERDTLTGLKNRKTFDDKINRIIAQTRAAPAAPDDRRVHGADEHHWLGICDIDHFKRVNDTYGHVFGDEVLLLFAALMRKVFRAEDLLFRFGGEEFVIVLAPTTAERAATAFERFRAAVAEFPFPQVGRVTTSIGFVRISPDDIPAKVVGQADAALYWAKNHGRDRVSWYDELVAGGEITPAETTDSVELF